MTPSERQARNDEEKSSTQENADDVHSKHRIRLPFFVNDEDIGLGTVVRKMTYAVGIRQPCAGCRRREVTLNRWISFHK